MMYCGVTPPPGPALVPTILPCPATITYSALFAAGPQATTVPSVLTSSAAYPGRSATQETAAAPRTNAAVA